MQPLTRDLIKWTRGAIECYQRGCRCKGCPVFSIIGKQCRMKQSVIGLVAKFGAPKEKK